MVLDKVGCFRVALNHTAHLVPFEIVLAKHMYNNKVYDAINEDITKYIYNAEYISNEYNVYKVVFDRVNLKLHVLDKVRNNIQTSDLPYLKDILEELEATLMKFDAVEIWRQLPIDEFCIAPASTKYHHNYLGGLLVHTTEVVKIAAAMSVLFGLSNADTRDVVIAALLHDIGKIKCYNIQQPFTSTDFNKQIGHIADSLQWIEKISQHGVPLNKVDLTQIIISHHGRFDPSIQRDPATSKAWFVHFADLLSSQLTTNDPFSANLYNINDIAANFYTVSELGNLHIDTLLVDLDGTLISETDPDEDHMEVFNTIVKEVLNDVNVVVPTNSNNHIHCLQELEAKLKTITPLQILHKLTYHDINKMAPIIDVEYLRSLPYKKILVTQRTRNVRDVLDGLHLTDVFDDIVERVEKKKVALVGYAPDSTLLVGDSSSDVLCAFNSGIYCLTKKSSYNEAKQVPLLNRYKKVFVIDDANWNEWVKHIP